VIPACAVTGEAAGTAAALAVDMTGGRLSEVPLDVLQAALTRQGAVVDARLLD
jgi:hypothetical protein